jgi:hypothetical protein
MSARVGIVGPMATTAWGCAWALLLVRRDGYERARGHCCWCAEMGMSVRVGTVKLVD